MSSIHHLSRRNLQRPADMLPGTMPGPSERGSSPAGWEIQITEVKGRLSGFEEELRNQGRRQEEGFERVDRSFNQLFTRVDAANTRPVPWGIIVTGAVGICGLGLTISTALALWANAYFGAGIRSAEARAIEAHSRLDRQTERLDQKMERLQEFQWQTRSEIHATSSLPASSPPPSLPAAARTFGP